MEQEMTTNFDWMTRESVYEPAPIPRPTPIPLVWKVFLTMAAIVIVCGGLAAVVVI